MGSNLEKIAFKSNHIQTIKKISIYELIFYGRTYLNKVTGFHIVKTEGFQCLTHNN